MQHKFRKPQLGRTDAVKIYAGQLKYAVG